MQRADMIARVADRREPWDVLIVGGGATGAGVALDAAARGYSTLLLEAGDFGTGTSSRSTKLVHGGVRYLRQGHVGLVFDALRERGRLRANAPHLVHDRPFVLPCYSRLDVAFYGVGLKAYDLLAARFRFGGSKIVSAGNVVTRLPTVRATGLRGGVVYHDGQFDDSRLLIHLLMTAAERRAVVLNYAPVVGLARTGGAVTGATFRDLEAGTEVRVAAKVVVNAAGPFCDDVRKMADPAAGPMLAASQGSHVVLDRSFLPTDHALLVPKTPDGRVLFAIPWHGHTVVGTTDVPIDHAPAEPRPTAGEIDFILDTAGRYLAKAPRREDVLSTFAGVRPLVKGGGKNTAALSRDFVLKEECPGLLTITGGKWTTYRSMAEACVDRAAGLAGLPKVACPTRGLKLHGHHEFADSLGHLGVYGADAAAIRGLADVEPGLRDVLHPSLPYLAAEVVWAARFEMARTVGDVLARRTRALFLNTAAAVAAVPKVADLLARELDRNGAWAADQVRAFGELAAGYRV
jgi:glycerol-3-phosphate dehydrogenase